MISESDVAKAAALARIQLTEIEVHQFKADLERALAHFAKIQEIATEGVEPLFSPAQDTVSFRADEVHEFDQMEQVLAGAPEVAGRLFKVPPVV
jgi:aspartyl-tRNA(Asn)/glutamyl-tRNA(Gln) amidotransferase subunit C